jgi:hypothetical protein
MVFGRKYCVQQINIASEESTAQHKREGNLNSNSILEKIFQYIFI